MELWMELLASFRRQEPGYEKQPPKQFMAKNEDSLISSSKIHNGYVTDSMSQEKYSERLLEKSQQENEKKYSKQQPIIGNER